MKKVLKVSCIILCFFGMLLFTGCRVSPSPAAVVNAFLKSFQRNDLDGMKRYSVDGVFNKAFENTDDPAFDLVIDKCRNLDFLTSSETIEGDHAKVTVTIRTYDFITAIYESISDTVNMSIEIGEEDLTEEMINGFLKENVMSAFENASMSLMSTCYVNMVMIDGVWIVDSYENNTDLIDLATGYAMDVLENVY